MIDFVPKVYFDSKLEFKVYILKFIFRLQFYLFVEKLTLHKYMQLLILPWSNCDLLFLKKK